MRSFAAALDAIPLALAENSGLPPIETLADIKSQQITQGNSRLGVDCTGKGQNDMKQQYVYDPLISKRQQFLLATQVCCSLFSCFPIILTIMIIKACPCSPKDR